MRKKTLAKTVERLAQAKAKAKATAAAAVAKAEEEANAAVVKAPQSPATVPMDVTLSSSASQPPNSAASPLHPSLPPKPGSSPFKPSSSSSQDAPKPLTPVPPAEPTAPTPTPLPQLQLVPTPIETTYPTDEQILKLEEVRSLDFLRLSHLFLNASPCYRTSSDGRGSRSGRPVISIYSISEKSEQVMSNCS